MWALPPRPLRVLALVGTPDPESRFALRALEEALLEFPGEQHGFRRAENVQRALEAELYFYAKVFKFIPADEIEPVTIDNLAN